MTIPVRSVGYPAELEVQTPNGGRLLQKIRAGDHHSSNWAAVLSKLVRWLNDSGTPIVVRGWVAIRRE